MRKGQAKKRSLLPDPKYKDPLVTRFVNSLMKDGKKNLAYSLFYGAIDKITEKTEEKGLEVWKKALNNVFPSVEVKRRRVGGSTFQIPVEVRAGRKVSLGVKWLVNCARARGEKTMTERLVNETIAASKGEGNAVKKKNDIHKMAESNRAFSHFRIR
ncbi:MAG: 30S ribosomal protein S7 [Amoebophilaceae bacterium]|jgi:small subunit ribosomal protein S7|nr:30S ribosomal protein S7 [Amoebophilaceae bacterium]